VKRRSLLGAAMFATACNIRKFGKFGKFAIFSFITRDSFSAALGL
jgi:hypothetical protein